MARDSRYDQLRWLLLQVVLGLPRIHSGKLARGRAVVSSAVSCRLAKALSRALHHARVLVVDGAAVRHRELVQHQHLLIRRVITMLRQRAAQLIRCFGDATTFTVLRDGVAGAHLPCLGLRWTL